MPPMRARHDGGMRERNANLNVRVSREEADMLRELAADRDLTASTLIRHMIRRAYSVRFAQRRRARARRMDPDRKRRASKSRLVERPVEPNGDGNA